MEMLNCWSTSASSSCKSTSRMQEALADFDVVTSSSRSIDDNIFWANNQSTNSCLDEQSIAGELWSNCPDIFSVLSELELDLKLQDASPQLGDGDSLQNLPALPEHELRDPLLLGSSHGERKEERSSQDGIDYLRQHHHRTEPKGIYKKQSQGKQAQGPKQSCLPDGCNLDGIIRKKRCSERRRRKRINAKLTSLRQLLPHSYKRDQASILEDTIKYIQSLKLQLDMVLKSSGQNQLQAMYLPQTHASMMNPAFGIGAAQQFVAPCGYGSMVTPQPVQVASIPQPHAAIPPILCPPHYFTAGSYPPPFDATKHH